MKALKLPLYKLSFKLEYPFKKNFFNLLSFQRSFAYISYPCQWQSGFLKALAETRK